MAELPFNVQPFILLDETLGLTSAVGSELRDNRTGKNTQYGITAFLRHSWLAVYDETRKHVSASGKFPVAMRLEFQEKDVVE